MIEQIFHKELQKSKKISHSVLHVYWISRWDKSILWPVKML